MNEVERFCREWQLATVGANKRYARVLRFKKRCVVDADSGDPCFLRVPRLQIVRVLVAAVARHPDVENRIAPCNLCRCEKRFEHFSPLIRGDPDRQGVGPSYIVLGINGHG